MMKQKVMAGIAALVMALPMGIHAAAADTPTYENLTYYADEDSVMITGCTDPEATEVTIPAEIDGLPVTSVAYTAFRDHIFLTNVTVDPDNTYLDSQDGVLYTEGLTQLIWYGIAKDAAIFTMPEGVETIGDCAFYMNPFLEEVEFSSTLTSICSSAFWRCDNLKKAHLPEGLLMIGNEGFAHCYHLEDVTLPSTLTMLNTSAFTYCSSLKTIEVPESVSELMNGTFSGTGLISYTAAKTHTVLPTNFFNNCANLKTVYLPDTIETIKASAFEETGLTDVYYDGTMAQWDMVEIVPEDNEALLAATIHCTDGDIVPQTAVPGDATGDAEINIADVILINRALLGDATLDDAAREMADVDGNGTLDATDSLYILKYIVELIDTLPVA